MTPELLLLNTRIALLVLVTSGLAFLLGWRLRGSHHASAALEPTTTAPVDEPLPPPASLEQAENLKQIETLGASLASAEQQCLAALEQRDEAERVAHDRGREVRRLTEELEALRAEHLALVQAASTNTTAAESAHEETRAAAGVIAEEALQPARQLIEKFTVEIESLEHQLTELTAEQHRAETALADLNTTASADKAALKAATKQSKDAERRLSQATESLARKRRQLRAVTRAVAAAAEGLKADDLTRIKGIKTVLNEQLHNHGIFSYQQIAHWDADDILAFGELLSFKNRMIKDGWQEQARALHQASHPGS